MSVLQTDILLSVWTHLGEFYVNELKPEVTYMVWKLYFPYADDWQFNISLLFGFLYIMQVWSYRLFWKYIVLI